MSPPPTLPDGQVGIGVQSLIPMAGAGVAMSMMMFLRGSGFAALGAVVLVVALGAAGVDVPHPARQGRAQAPDPARALP